MKRYGNLWEHFISKDNFQIALHNAIRGKKKRDYVKRFMLDPENNLERIRQDVIHKRFHTAKYTEKEIYEPKKRIIYMLPFVPDRIVQHALMLILIPILEKLFITDTYASIDGRGMHKGSKRVMQFIANNDYFLKCDIRKFYPSVNHDILMDIIKHKIKDKDLLWLIEDIVRSFPGDTNLPIGNYFSQWAGNWYLNELDYYVKNKLKCKCYLRYCDDFCLFSNDKKQLAEWREKIRIFLAERLKLTYSKAEISHIKNGVDFLGYRHFRRNGKRYILVRKRTAKRMIKHIRKNNPDKIRSVVCEKITNNQTVTEVKMSTPLELDTLYAVNTIDKFSPQGGIEIVAADSAVTIRATTDSHFTGDYSELPEIVDNGAEGDFYKSDVLSAIKFISVSCSDTDAKIVLSGCSVKKKA